MAILYALVFRENEMRYSPIAIALYLGEIADDLTCDELVQIGELLTFPIGQNFKIHEQPGWLEWSMKGSDTLWV